METVTQSWSYEDYQVQQRQTLLRILPAQILASSRVRWFVPSFLIETHVAKFWAQQANYLRHWKALPSRMFTDPQTDVRPSCRGPSHLQPARLFCDQGFGEVLKLRSPQLPWHLLIHLPNLHPIHSSSLSLSPSWLVTSLPSTSFLSWISSCLQSILHI